MASYTARIGAAMADFSHLQRVMTKQRRGGELSESEPDSDSEMPPAQPAGGSGGGGREESPTGFGGCESDPEDLPVRNPRPAPPHSARRHYTARPPQRWLPISAFLSVGG